MKLNLMKKYILAFLGSVSLAIGIIGIFIPILPSTPFLLLTSILYLRSSERMYNWVINHKIFGAYIYGYLTYKAIPKKTKISTMIFLWSTLIISMVMVPSMHIRIFLVAVGVGVTVHLMTLKTMSYVEMKELNDLYSDKPEEQAKLSTEK